MRNAALMLCLYDKYTQVRACASDCFRNTLKLSGRDEIAVLSYICISKYALQKSSRTQVAAKRA
jgi:hypothetical protein